MAGLAQAIYERTPRWMQSLLVDAAGVGTHRRKYGAEFRAALAELEETERLPRPGALAQQERRLRKVLEHASREVPFYRQLGVPPDELSAWPVVGKAEIARDPRAFQTPAAVGSGVIRLQTSGTTGTPLTVPCTPAAYQREMAFRWRHRAWAGAPFGSRGAYVAGHPVVPAGMRKPPFWRHDHVEDRLLMSSYHLGPDTLPLYLNALLAFRPDFLHGYPSSLYLLAGAALETGLRPVPRAVLCASETLFPFQRERIETAFGAKVYNWYGQTELTCNIVECREGRLHVRTDYGYLEFADDGSMICTGFVNPAMPFVRYRTGDRAAPVEGDCRCGAPFPLVERLEGRAEDYVVTGDGFLVGRLDHLLKGPAGVAEAQVVQERAGEIVIRIVRGAGYDRRSEEAICAEAERRLGAATRISFEYPSRIERGPGGKYRFIVSAPGANGRSRGELR